MTRKDYELIAAAVSEARADMADHPGRLAGAAQTARRLASALRTTNPRFDRDRFLAACGVDS
ncbi:hypothetical protein [Novosphingobium meiothermophilum]|uniref:hypothetical protein n=1 Tax=Novosphingobium meiothermophilum TaxID=2202251 RepID=UPI000D6DE522|nr:hypothetical protein [Novosphingobium meiothermophilum]